MSTKENKRTETIYKLTNQIIFVALPILQYAKYKYISKYINIDKIIFKHQFHLRSKEIIY